MNLKETIEQHPIYVFLSAVFIGFLAGLGTYKGIIEIAQLETLPKSEVSALRKYKEDPDNNRNKNNEASPIVLFPKPDANELRKCKEVLKKYRDKYPEPCDHIRPFINTPNKRDHQGNTYFYRAAREGCDEIVSAMLNYHPDFGYKDTGGDTPLLRAAWDNRLEVVRILAQRADVNTLGANLDTPLMYASRLCHVEIVKVLLDNDANPCIKNKHDYTAKRNAEEYCGKVGPTKSAEIKRLLDTHEFSQKTGRQCLPHEARV